MRRGDIITIALQGDFGKPRPALVVQSDLVEGGDHILVAPFSSELVEASTRRLTIQPDQTNNLKLLSQIMLDRLTSTQRIKTGPTFGRLSLETMGEVDWRLTALLGLADAP